MKSKFLIFVFIVLVGSDHALSKTGDDFSYLDTVENNQDSSESINQKYMTWNLIKERSLKQNLKAWAEVVGWEVNWLLRNDYPVLTDRNYRGVFAGENGVAWELLNTSYSGARKKSFNVSFDFASRLITVKPGGHKIAN